jgi:hypothetical protein
MLRFMVQKFITSMKVKANLSFSSWKSNFFILMKLKDTTLVLHEWEAIEGKPEGVTQAVIEYNHKLQKSNIPKLLIYGEPGAVITKPVVDWCVKNLSNLKTVNIGAGIHYLQEDNPHIIGLEIAKWYESIPAS